MTINYNGKTFNSIEELIEYKRTHPEEMEGVEVADKIIVNNFSSIDTLKDFGSRHSSNEGGSKRRFTNINIGGKSFNSWDEVKQYKREHPEWTGVGQIIDSVGPGETVTFNSGSIHGSVSGSSRKSGGSSNSSSGRRTIITSGSVTINRGGKKYSFSGDKIEKYDGTWYVDGKPVDPETYGGSYDEYNVSKIEITGNVQTLATTSGDITVHGDVQNIRTGSGDVECDNAVNVNTGSGDVHANSITGMVSTGSGDVYHGR